MTGPGKNSAGLLPSVFILVFILAYLVIGFATLDDTTRFVPLLAGGVTMVLLVIDMLRVIMGRETGARDKPEGGGVSAAAPFREMTAILFVAGGVLLVYTVGFLIAIPAYLFASIAFLGKQSLRTAGVVTGIASLAVYVVFEVALDYDLYPGLLFY